MLFHCKNSCMNAPQRFDICILPVSFVFTVPYILFLLGPLTSIHDYVILIIVQYYKYDNTFWHTDIYDKCWSSYVCTSVMKHLQLPFTKA